MQWITLQSEPKCWGREKHVWSCDYVKVFVKGTDMKEWLGLKFISTYTARAGLYTFACNGCLQYKGVGKIATFPCLDMNSSYEIRLIRGPCDVGHFSNLAPEHY